MAARPVTDADRAKVRELHAAGKSRNAIGRAIGRSGSTVSSIAADLGLSFERATTAEATRAQQLDNAARRAQFAALLLDDLFRLRERIWSPYTALIGSKDGPQLIEVELPDAGAVRNFMAAIGVAVDKHTALLRADDTSADAARSMLGNLMDGLRQLHHADQAAEPESDGD